MFKEISVYKAYFMLLLCGLGWASSTIIIKVFISDIGPYHLMFGRFIFAFLFIFIIKPDKLIRSSKKDALISMGLGCIIFIAYATAILSLKYTTASKSGFLIALPVILVPLLLLVVHKKRPTKWVIVTAALSLSGLYLISDMDGIGFNQGDALAIISSIAYSVYILMVDKVAKTINEFTLVAFQLISMCIISFVAIFFTEGLNPQMLIDGIIPIVITGFFGTAMTLYFQVHAQRVATPESVGLLLLSEPIFTFLMAWGILNEYISPIGFVGGLIIILSMILAIVKKL